MHKIESVVCRNEEIGEGQLKEVSVGGEKALLIRVNGQVHALGATCPHHGCSLEGGVVTGTRLKCACHHAVFDIETGEVLAPPSPDPIPVHEVRFEDGEIIVSITDEVPNPDARITPKRDANTYIIVGGGAAGKAAAEAFRSTNKTGRLIMVSKEEALPYDRTFLTKDYLRGEKDDEAVTLRSRGYFERLGVELMLGRNVVSVDVRTKELTLDDGSILNFAGILLATGSVPRSIDVPGHDLPGIHTIRSLGSAKTLLEDLGTARRVSVIGGGFIGLEAAASLRARDLEVTLIHRSAALLAPQFGPDVSAMLIELHRQQGVTLELGTPVDHIAIGPNGRAASVILKNDREIQTDLIVVGYGAFPVTGYLRGLSRNEDGSLDVDASMRAAAGVFVAGDIARFPHPATGEMIRIEHWRHALATGAVAGGNMAGLDLRHEDIPFFWTEQYGLFLDYCGHAATWNDIAVHGSIPDRDFIAFYLRDGVPLAAAACNRPRDLAAVSELMRQGRLPDGKALKSGSFDFLSML